MISLIDTRLFSDERLKHWQPIKIQNLPCFKEHDHLATDYNIECWCVNANFSYSYFIFIILVKWWGLFSDSFHKLHFSPVGGDKWISLWIIHSSHSLNWFVETQINSGTKQSYGVLLMLNMLMLCSELFMLSEQKYITDDTVYKM